MNNVQAKKIATKILEEMCDTFWGVDWKEVADHEGLIEAVATIIERETKNLD